MLRRKKDKKNLGFGEVSDSLRFFLGFSRIFPGFGVDVLFLALLF